MLSACNIPVFFIDTSYCCFPIPLSLLIENFEKISPRGGLWRDKRSAILSSTFSFPGIAGGEPSHRCPGIRSLTFFSSLSYGSLISLIKGPLFFLQNNIPPGGLRKKFLRRIIIKMNFLSVRFCMNTCIGENREKVCHPKSITVNPNSDWDYFPVLRYDAYGGQRCCRRDVLR